MGLAENVGCLLGGLLGIVLGIIIFISFDKVPATPLDYESLEKQVMAIQQNPDLLLKTDCNINVNGEVIKINFENDNCKITAKYNQNFEVISTSKEDKSVFWLIAFGIALLGGIYAYGFGSLILTILIFWIVALWKLILKTLESKIVKYQQ